MCKPGKALKARRIRFESHQTYDTLQRAPKSATRKNAKFDPESTPAGLQNFRPDTILAAHEVVEESDLSESPNVTMYPLTEESTLKYAGPLVAL